ncbi:mediator of RNA polymerase II transcription subunit 22-like [Paramacrobiotus metropolitanus]|uniref:mediator of RNA polymerase II transcription subunit 22-like n=1 Tax=Paramacrobiotus metropolitanus TaxID=2943436 RepID=UPI0024460E82|nr:mediator of RNA polymerase II transcription subunit 22-like [Paramacrobiotus metropolitanus]XP_055342597.1 mediator of RNA polymerase II transcription subunit 22-like [Paramacrobiotus metropolitanus]XP_055342605.1 mediator of RNA polymerase II transcription subunit 22-like [Paramacrobiotus metropolitanus]XP_055342612.1 mediator of RNA polymerase II transcription subunit 22-like [Paramacrobiotus metropolitanus]
MAHAAGHGRTTLTGGNKENVLKTLSKKQKDDVRSIQDNFAEILKLVKVEDERGSSVRVQTVEQEQLELGIRATNLVRCAESLMKLNEDLKKYFFLNDFPFISQSVQKAREAANADIKNSQSRMMSVYREMQAELHDLEDEYGSVWYIKNSNPTKEKPANGDL